MNKTLSFQDWTKVFGKKAKYSISGNMGFNLNKQKNKQKYFEYIYAETMKF